MALAIEESIVATESRLTIEGELARRITVEDSLWLVRVLGLLAVARDASEICSVLVERGLFGRPIERCVLAREAGDGGAHVLASDSLARRHGTRERPTLSDPSPLTDALRRDALVEVCDDVALIARYPELERCPEGDPILLAIPLHDHDRIVGALGVRWARRSELSAKERALLLLLASRLGPIVERCVEMELERKKVEERDAAAQRAYALARISRELAEAALDEHEILERAARGVSDAFGDSCVIRMFGGARPEAIARRPDHPLTREELDRLLRDASAATPPGGVVMRRAHARTNGLRRHKAGVVASSVSASIMVNGEPAGLLVVLRSSREELEENERVLLDDVAHRVGLALGAARAYASAQEARDRAERAARGRDRVLSAVTHDLRAPLATVHLGTSLLADVGPGEEAHTDIVSRIARATGRMRRLVEDLLDLGQLESGVLRVQRAPVPLVRLLADTADELQERAREAGKELACAPPQGPVAVLGDFQRLQQVLVNLIVNAIDHTPPGTWIVLGAELVDGCARVWVEDDGPGIAPDLAEHLFEPHVRGSRATAHGAGLGLWIAKGIVEAHGADLRVVSATDRGTRFEMQLTLAPEE